MSTNKFWEHAAQFWDNAAQDETGEGAAYWPVSGVLPVDFLGGS